MNKESKKNMDYMLEIDRMINEGLGSGMLDHDYQWKQLEAPKYTELGSKSGRVETDAS